MTIKMILTEKQIKTAVEFACKELGAKPEDVFSGGPDYKRGHDYSVSRARSYAALALRAVNEGGSTEIPKAVGYRKSPKTYFSDLDARIRRGEVDGWWSDKIFMRVIEAVENAA